MSSDDSAGKVNRPKSEFHKWDRSGEPLREFAIHLPGLEAATESKVVADHCRMVGSFLVASQLEELKAFEVVDALVELFQRGLLPLGPAGTRLHDYCGEAANRLSAADRRNFYAITLGLPGGEAGNAANSDFQDLWLRFVSSVSSFVRQRRSDPFGRPELPGGNGRPRVLFAFLRGGDPSGGSAMRIASDMDCPSRFLTSAYRALLAGGSLLI